MEVILPNTNLAWIIIIIDSDLSTSSMDMGVNNLLDSLVVETTPKGNHTLVHYNEGLGRKGDESLPLGKGKGSSCSNARRLYCGKKWGIGELVPTCYCLK